MALAKFTLSGLLTCALGAFFSPAQAQTAVTTGLNAEKSAGRSAVMQDYAFRPDHREGKVKGAIFYPAKDAAKFHMAFKNGVWTGASVAKKGKITDGKHPLVLLSHGLGGNVRAVSWLAAGLAERGAIVVALNHPDSTTRDFDLMKGLDHGTRAEDLTALLDDMLANAAWAEKIDRDRVMAAGFSYGGWTALSLGGVRADLDGYAAHCNEVGDKSTHCADIARGGVDLSDLDAQRWNDSFKDSRITHVAAIDPGLTYGVTAAHVAALAAQTQIITLGDAQARLLATDVIGNGFISLLPDAQQVTISPASHYSALGLCTPKGPRILAQEGEPPVCSDPSGADRAQIHRQIVDSIAAQIGL